MGEVGSFSRANPSHKARRKTMDYVTTDHMKQMSDALDNAQKDDTPFLSVANGSAQVVGNPMKTEKKSYDYKVLFVIPKDWKDQIGGGRVVKENDYEAMVEAEFKNVFVPGRYRVDVITAVTGILPFLRKTTPNGNVEAFTIDEYGEIVKTLNSEVLDAIYNVVGTVLRIDPQFVQCMHPISAIVNALKMFNDVPDVMNEADLFTESFVGKQ